MKESSIYALILMNGTEFNVNMIGYSNRVSNNPGQWFNNN